MRRPHNVELMSNYSEYLSDETHTEKKNSQEK